MRLHGIRQSATNNHNLKDATPTHSLLHCKRADDYRDRMCHLEHVCWDTVDRTWVFFENSDENPPTLLPTERGVMALVNMSTPLVQLRREEEPYEVPLPLRVSSGMHPAAREAHAAPPEDEATFTYHHASAHIVFESFWAENFGHAVGDDIFPAYFLLSSFGFLRNDFDMAGVQLLSLQRPTWRLGPLSSEQAARGAKHLNNFARLLFKSPIMDLYADTPYTKD